MMLRVRWREPHCGCIQPIISHGITSPHAYAEWCVHAQQHTPAPTPLLVCMSQQHCTPPFLLRLQGLLTLVTESFASFDHSTSALSVPGLYSALRRIHVALQTAVPSHSTRGYGQPHPSGSQCTAKDHTGLSPCVAVPFQDSSWHWDHTRDTASRSKAHSVCWNPTKADRADKPIRAETSQVSARSFAITAAIEVACCSSTE